MLLLQRRDDFKCSQDDTQLGSLFFTPLLFSRLLEDDWYCYDRVMNWVRVDQDVFSKEKLFFPIHQPGHWGLLVVYVQRRTIKYYDSLGCDGNKYLCAARQWLRNEHLAKKGIELNTSQWVLEDMEKNVPQQKGGYDCGVFTMLCADYLSEDLPLAYRHTQIITHRENITESMLPAMDLMIS
jgi:sentrin-specific protease 1